MWQVNVDPLPQERSNSYIAAPQVAGLIAYFMSLPEVNPFSTEKTQVAKSVWQCFNSGICAYPRRLNGLRVLYNLLDGTIENQCAPPPFKRDTEDQVNGVCTLKSQPLPVTTGPLDTKTTAGALTPGIPILVSTAAEIAPQTALINTVSTITQPISVLSSDGGL